MCSLAGKRWLRKGLNITIVCEEKCNRQEKKSCQKPANKKCFKLTPGLRDINSMCLLISRVVTKFFLLILRLRNVGTNMKSYFYTFSILTMLLFFTSSNNMSINLEQNSIKWGFFPFILLIHLAMNVLKGNMLLFYDIWKGYKNGCLGTQ